MNFPDSPIKPEASCLPILSKVRCTIDCEVMGECKDTVHLLAGQKRLEDKYRDLEMLPKVKKADMAGTMGTIKDYMRLCHGVLRSPLAYILRT